MTDHPLKASEALAKIEEPLWRIASEYLDKLDELEAMAEENEGVLPDSVADEFAGLEGAVVEKIEGCGHVVRKLQVRSSMVKDGINRLKELLKHVEASEKRLKDYVAMNMDRMALKRSDGELLKVRVQDNPPGAIITDEFEVPDKYVTACVEMPMEDFNRLMLMAATILNAPSENPELIQQQLDIKLTRKIRSSEAIRDWKDSGGELQIPGLIIQKTRGIRVW